MDKKEFDDKFKKFIEILTTDDEICNKFVQIPTVRESHSFACSLVGEMGLEMYENAIKSFIDESELGDVSAGVKLNYNKLFVDSLIK